MALVVEGRGGEWWCSLDMSPPCCSWLLHQRHRQRARANMRFSLPNGFSARFAFAATACGPYKGSGGPLAQQQEPARHATVLYRTLLPAPLPVQDLASPTGSDHRTPSIPRSTLAPGNDLVGPAATNATCIWSTSSRRRRAICLERATFYSIVCFPAVCFGFP